jgi:aspartyl-tRNA(Asn)/glutamyl-tRNA(Gln) amidotransferase subunit A
MSDDAVPTIAEVAPLIAAGKVSSRELTQKCLNRIERDDATLHTFVTLMGERALAAANRADREIASGAYRGPLHGIPYAVKDVFDTEGVRTTGGSRAFLNRVPDAHSAAVDRMEQAGAVLLGKLATDELTYGGVDLEAGFPPARNPWDPRRDPGGSSSGAGAAVAAGFCLAALGTDTGGSVRLPAGLCGIVGLKPTFGRVSRRGVMLNAYSLDHCGLMTWTAEDCAILLQATAGYDPGDPASADIPVPVYRSALRQDLQGVRVGVVSHFFKRDAPAGEEACAAMDTAVDVLWSLGAQISDVALSPLKEYAEPKAVIQWPEIFILYGDEARTRPENFGPKFRARIAGGDRVAAVDYVRAQDRRRELTRQMAAAMSSLDAVITCGAYGPALYLHDVAAQPTRNQPGDNTVPFNVTGYPAISVCIGFSREGLPLAMQVAGKPFDESMVLRIAYAYERATPWRASRPRLHQNAELTAHGA